LDVLTTGITASHRGHVSVVKEIIAELEKVFGKSIPLEDIERECELRGVTKDKAEEIIQKMSREGELYSPKHGIITRM
jgi:replicative DNA helicase Mcm